jgi:hypothetical protein
MLSRPLTKPEVYPNIFVFRCIPPYPCYLSIDGGTKWGTTSTFPPFCSRAAETDDGAYRQAMKPETASRVRGRIEAVLDAATVRGFRQGP